MLLLPAIDLMDGKVVRLRQGKQEEKTVYSDDPVAFAKEWEQQGGDYLHIVDLDAAFSGESRNLGVVEKIASTLTIPCEFGGGMRSEAMIQAAIDAGVSRVVIGTRAAQSIDFVRQMCGVFGGERIAVGVDANNGIVSIKGWTESSGLTAQSVIRKSLEAGAQTIIYTDIATDGMLTGPNFKEISDLLKIFRCQFVASGGVSSEEDIVELGQLRGLYGTIIGKALYDGKVDLASVRQKVRSIQGPTIAHE